MTLHQLRLPTWRRHAACIGQTELFFGHLQLEQAIAVAVCHHCGVRETCLAEALDEERLLGTWAVSGVRGGLRPAERIELLDAPTDRYHDDRPDVIVVNVGAHSGRRAWPHRVEVRLPR